VRKNYYPLTPSVTLDPTSRGLDPILTCDGLAGETLHGVSKLALREGASVTLDQMLRCMGFMAN